jgi:hypothetical protein
MLMIESMVELLLGLCFSALILVVSACILASIFAALRAVNPEGDREREKEIFDSVAKATVLDDRMIETGVIVVLTNPETHYGL